MLSALILSEHSYPALLLTEQLEHQRFVRPGPLVLRSEPLNSPAPTVDKDRTVSRRSEPSSRTTLTGEQPDPWDLLQPQVEPTFVLLRYSLGGYRPSKTGRLPVSLSRSCGQRLVIPVPKGGVSLLALRSPKGPLHSLPLTLSIETETTVTACSKGA